MTDYDVNISDRNPQRNRLFLGLVLVGYVVPRFVSYKSPMGAITGAIACGSAFMCYMLFLGMFGYSYEDSYSFWITLVIAVGYGGITGYKGFEDQIE